MKQIKFIHKDDKYIELLNQFCAKRHLFSNYYGIDNDDVDYYATESTLVIKANEEGFSRIYVMSDNEQETIEILNTLPKKCAINIPSRNGINEWLAILAHARFRFNDKYVRYTYRICPEGNVDNVDFALQDDVLEIDKQLHTYFNDITGHLPNTLQLSSMIKQHQLVVNRNSKNKLIDGALGFSISKGRGYLNFWFDNSGNGLVLLEAAFAIFQKNNVKNIIFWTSEKNKYVQRIHQLYGAVADGMEDYIYINA